MESNLLVPFLLLLRQVILFCPIQYVFFELEEDGLELFKGGFLRHLAEMGSGFGPRNKLRYSKSDG